MIFNKFNEAESAETVEVDGLQNKDPNTAEGMDNIADEIETNMQTSALEAATYFDGGDRALREFCQSEDAQVLVESRKMSKRTFVRLGKNDDLTRRVNMACLILAREHKDPLFNKLALNRVKERKLRKAIFAKYSAKATKAAKVSQLKHIKDMKKMPAIQKFNPFK